MAKCKNCGKSGLFLKLKNGYCNECINKTEKINKKFDDFHEKFMSNSFNKFSVEHKNDTKKYIDIICNNRSKIIESKYIDEKIKLHKENISVFEELKNFCNSCGEGGKIFFEKYYLHCHNSTNDDFIYIQEDIDKLNYLEKNYDKLKSDEEKYNSLIVGLEDKILKILNENNGILQKDLIKMFDPLLKNDISNFIYKLTKDNKIEKKKVGNSNALFLIK